MVNAIYMVLIGIEIQNLNVNCFMKMKKKDLRK